MLLIQVTGLGTWNHNRRQKLVQAKPRARLWHSKSNQLPHAYFIEHLLCVRQNPPRKYSEEQKKLEPDLGLRNKTRTSTCSKNQSKENTCRLPARTEKSDKLPLPAEPKSNNMAPSDSCEQIELNNR
jgi:hypothetical protein